MSFSDLNCKYQFVNTAAHPGNWIFFNLNKDLKQANIHYQIFIRAFNSADDLVKGLARNRFIKQMHMTSNAIDLLIYSIDEKVALCRLNDIELGNILSEVNHLKILLARHRQFSITNGLSKEVLEKISSIKEKIVSKGVAFEEHLDVLIKIIGKSLCCDLPLINWFEKSIVAPNITAQQKMVDVNLGYSSLYQSLQNLINRIESDFHFVVHFIESRVGFYQTKVESEKIKYDGMFDVFDQNNHKIEISYEKFIEDTLRKYKGPKFNRTYSTFECDPNFINIVLKKAKSLVLNYFSHVKNYNFEKTPLDLITKSYDESIQFLSLFFSNVERTIIIFEDALSDEQRKKIRCDELYGVAVLTRDQAKFLKEILYNLLDFHLMIDCYIFGRLMEMHKIINALESKKREFNELKSKCSTQEIEAYLTHKLAVDENFKFPLEERGEERGLDFEFNKKDNSPTKGSKVLKKKPEGQKSNSKEDNTPLETNNEGLPLSTEKLSLKQVAEVLPSPKSIPLNSHLSDASWHIENLKICENNGKSKEEFINSITLITSSAGYAIEQLLKNKLKLIDPTHNLATLYGKVYQGKPSPVFISEMFLATAWTRYTFEQMSRYRELTIGRVKPPMLLSRIHKIALEGSQTSEDEQFQSKLISDTIGMAKELSLDQVDLKPRPFNPFKFKNDIAKDINHFLNELQAISKINHKNNSLQQAELSLKMVLMTLKNFQQSKDSISFTLYGFRTVTLMSDALEQILHGLIFLKGKQVEGKNHELNELIKLAEVEIAPVADWYQNVENKGRYPFQVTSNSRGSTILENLKLFRLNPDIESGFHLQGVKQLKSNEIISEIESLILDTVYTFSQKVMKHF